jgi:hypothetical protein
LLIPTFGLIPEQIIHPPASVTSFSLTEMSYHSLLVDSGTPKLEQEGLILDACTEAEIDSVPSLSIPEKNALKMMVRRRYQGA